MSRPTAAIDLADVIGAIGSVRRRLDRGDQVAIERLAGDLAGALALAARAAPVSSAVMTAQLVALQDEIEQLMTSLDRERDRAARSLAELTRHSRAGRAYARKG